MKTRMWINDEGNNGVQYRDDHDIKVWFLTNLGWMPVNTDGKEPELFAEEIARNYGYEEATQSVARYFAGYED